MFRSPYGHHSAVSVSGRRCDGGMQRQVLYRRAPRVSLEIPDGELSTLAGVSSPDEGQCAGQDLTGDCFWKLERAALSFAMKSPPAKHKSDFKDKVTAQERSFEYILKSGLAGGLAGCAVSISPCRLSINNR